MDAEEPIRQVERELGMLLRRAHAASATIARKVHPDLEPGVYATLAYIARRPGVRASVVADDFGIGRATISRQLSRLTDLGLVDRRPDPDDQRGQLLELTPEGAARLEGARGARGGFLREALDLWEEDELRHLAAQLARLNAAVAASVRR
ncbi:MarR family winged helix-turn-helix transcriptional regulator [Cellulomonas soli]